MVKGFLVLLLLLSATFLFGQETVQVHEIETVIDTDNVLNAVAREPEPFDRAQTCRRRRCTC